MEKKKPLGFETPSMRIQEEYKEILEQIMAKKTDWEKILTVFNNILNLASDMASEYFKSVEPKKLHTKTLWRLSTEY